MSELIRYAIIADIHANKYALERFLNFIEEENLDIDKILNLGDMVHIGPHPKEVLNLCLNDKRFLNILGNNDLISLGRKEEEWPPGIEAHREWTINNIGEELMELFTKVPDSLNFEVKNNKFLMLHSYFYNLSNRTIRDNLLLYQEKTLKEFAEDYPEDVNYILLGHSHEQLYITFEGRTFINPGSLSITKKPIISFCIMEFNKKEVNFDFKNIEYDTSSLLRDYKERNVAEKEFLINYFYPFLN